MLGKAMLQSMVAYHRHVSERLLDLAATLPDDALDAEIAGVGRSIRQTFRHLVATDARWRSVLETHQRTWIEGDDDERATIADIARLQSAETAALSDWLEGQSEADLMKPAEIVWEGEAYRMEPWHGLLQLLMHGQQHRAEIATALTTHGAGPNDVDYIFFV